MKDKRPVNLDLLQMKFPVTAIVSILHRVSGLLVFLFIPMMLWVLQQSLHSQDSFSTLQHCFESVTGKLIAFAFLAAFIYHFVAGVRHLLMDLGVGESLLGAKRSAYTTMVVSVFLIIIAGIWIW